MTGIMTIHCTLTHTPQEHLEHLKRLRRIMIPWPGQAVSPYLVLHGKNKMHMQKGNM